MDTRAEQAAKAPHVGGRKIGFRLTLSFAAVVALMALGSAVALWQFNVVRRQAQHLHQVDLEAQAVLRVHADMLGFRESVDGLLAERRTDRFEAEMSPRRKVFLADVDRALQALRSSTGTGDRQSMLERLEAVRLEVETQLDAIASLAGQQDWPAVQLRLDQELKGLSRSTAAFVDEIEAQVGPEQAQTLERMRKVQRQAIWTLSLTALLTLATAGVLGAKVTRGITRPLARLDAAAQALARGEFQHQVAVTGGDELVNLGAVFNETAERLRELYDARRRSEEHYRALYEDTPSMYFTVDPEGTVVSVNRFGATYLGFAVEELIGQPASRVFFDEDKAAAAGHLAACLAQPERVFEWRLRKVRKDGTLLWVEETARAVRAEDGRLAVLIVCEDITESVRAEATELALRELLESAAVEWELTFDAIEAPILILNVGGRIARFNRAARELAASVGCVDLTSLAVDEVAPAQPWQKAAELAPIVAKTRSAMHAQVRDAASGRTWDLSAGPGTGPADEERVIVVARDVTRMAELQESLRRSETMSAMGGLVAGVAHEVRNPLFGISANLDAFEARYGEREEYRRMAAALRTETDRLAALMKELLDYGRPAYEKPSPERMHEVVADALGSCAELARRRDVTVVNEVPDEIGPVLMDRKRVTQVLQNLVENAIQHTPASGTVTIEAEEVQSNGRGWIACSVSDSGAGIAAGDLPHIFEPFFTRRKGGTGLGLSIVQRIVELHGGTIEARNRPGGGASMTLRLPRVDAAEPLA
jgi:PAS domain S-box-containing protein